jgi:hypothetical protein
LVSYFYHFSIIFYGFPKSGRKRKRKKVNSTGLKLSQAGPRTGESALAHAHAHAPAVSIMHRGPWSFEKPVKNPLHRRAYFGWKTQRLGSFFARPLILTPATRIPQLIAQFQVENSLSTVMAHTKDNPRYF